MRDCECLLLYVFIDEHFPYMDVFGATMKLRVVHQFDGGLVVLIEGNRFGEWNAKFREEMAKESATERNASLGVLASSSRVRRIFAGSGCLTGLQDSNPNLRRIALVYWAW